MSAFFLLPLYVAVVRFVTGIDVYRIAALCRFAVSYEWSVRVAVNPTSTANYRIVSPSQYAADQDCFV